MEKNTEHILDIHTHQSEAVSAGRAIINRELTVDCRPVADSLHEGYCYSIGIHPWRLTERNAGQQLQYLQDRLATGEFVAVGEAGLDKLAAAPMELQISVFGEQIKLSEKYKLPLIIHCVKAMDELLALKKEYQPQQAWIWHGFRGKPEQAEQLLKKGLWLSFGMRYSADAMKVVPDNRLFLETDDSPADIEEVLRDAAKMRGVGVERLRAAVRKNIRDIFFRA